LIQETWDVGSRGASIEEKGLKGAERFKPKKVPSQGALKMNSQDEKDVLQKKDHEEDIEVSKSGCRILDLAEFKDVNNIE
jgi:hypothetical protein